MAAFEMAARTYYRGPPRFRWPGTGDPVTTVKMATTTFMSVHEHNELVLLAVNVSGGVQHDAKADGTYLIKVKAVHTPFLICLGCIFSLCLNFVLQFLELNYMPNYNKNPANVVIIVVSPTLLHRQAVKTEPLGCFVS